MAVFACPACAKQLRVPDELRGKKVQCPGCGQAVIVPAAGAGRTATLAEAGKVSPGPRPANGSDAPTLPPAPQVLDPAPPPRPPAAAPSVDSSGQDTAGDGGKSGRYPAEVTAFLAPAQRPDEIGRLGPYRVLAVLGHGGMGVVFRAEDPHLERLVALKAMLPALAGSSSARERFFREAKAAAALKHPHIVTIFQVGEDRGAPYLAMEFLEGESLDERLKRAGRLPVAEVLRIGREIALGLATAHERGLVHRDVKPANIWLETRGDERPACPPSQPASGPLAATGGQVKILDFGLARSLSDQTHLTQSGAIVGTPAYMAPEQASGRPVDPRCDLFSLGGVLYRMATGELPFKGNDTLAILSAVLMDPPRPPREINPEVPAALSDLVLRLLAKKPEDRPTTAREVVQALEDLEGEAGTLPARPAPGTRKASRSTLGPTAVAPRPAKSRDRRPWLVAAAAGGVLLVGLVVLLLARGSGQRPPLADQGQVPANSDRGQVPRQEKDKEGQQEKSKEPARVEAPARVEIRTAAEALQALRSGDNDARVRAVSYLRQAAAGGPEQADIARLLAGLQGKRGIAGVDDALLRWATKEQVPALLAWWDRPGAPRAELRQAFVRLQDERGAAAVAGQLADGSERAGALAALRQMGPGVATQALLACANHADAGVREAARQQLGAWGVRVEPMKVEPAPVGWDTSKPGAVSTNSLGMKFAFVPRGHFRMGGGGGKVGDKEVEIRHDFFLGVYEVSQKEWQDLMGSNPSWFSRGGDEKDRVKDISDADLAQFPVERVSWNDAQEFLEKLNAKEKASGWVYRLPTEAEWEYACRGGPSSNPNQYTFGFDFYLNEPANQLLPRQANFGNALGRTWKVGSGLPNRLGLYDMHGNVREWCEDRYHGGSSRVIRGGGWRNPAANCRASDRTSFGPSIREYDLGFRLVAVPSGAR